MITFPKVSLNTSTFVPVRLPPGQRCYSFELWPESNDSIYMAHDLAGSDAILTPEALRIAVSQPFASSVEGTILFYAKANIEDTDLVGFTNDILFLHDPPEQVSPVEFHPYSGDFAVVAMLTPTDGATIYYTIDGTTPTSSSIEYSGFAIIPETVKIRAIGIKEEYKDSIITEYYFSFGPKVDPPFGECWMTDDSSNYIISEVTGEYLSGPC